MKNILLNSYVSHGLGILVLVSISIATIQYPIVHIPDTIKNSILLSILCYSSCVLILPKLTKHLLVERQKYILPVLASLYVIAMILIITMRIEYSRAVLIHGCFITLAWLYFIGTVRKDHKKLKLSAISNFDYKSLGLHKNIEITPISSLSDFQNTYSGLVVDLHKNLSPEESKFVADCSLNNIPVFHSDTIREMVDGKVQTYHLTENAIGTLQPNPIYSHIKRVWESLLIIASFPITIPLMLVTAALIKLENPGPAMFIQERIGQGGKAFKIYKFRSMTVKRPEDEDKFATEEQARVTKVGRIIRKVRIDELPQFFNVLKGDMSLIGPRPEQESFVKLFEQEIPFYGYRHMVKPGITGWAQTVQGYTDDTDSTREKLAHDLYYIKYLSFWLDMNIVIKTLKTMMTGFGAK